MAVNEAPEATAPPHPDMLEIALDDKPARIPIRNVWLLYLYASDLYRRMDQDERSRAEREPTQLPSLAAMILANEVESRLSRELTIGFEERHDALTAVRGRLDLLTTERRGLLAQGLVMCTFEEITVDTPRNRYVRAALSVAARRLRENSGHVLARRCQGLVDRLDIAGVTASAPEREMPRQMALGRQDLQDGRMLAAAQMVIDWLLPSQESGPLIVSRVRQDEVFMRSLFENGIRGFYEVNLDNHQVRSRQLHWTAGERARDPLVPVMKTDITIDRPDSTRLVIDTKFTSALATNPNGDSKLKSSHLYQIYAYLSTQVGVDEAVASSSGLLLYPSARGAESVDAMFPVQGHVVRAATVDLAAPTHQIRARLLELAGTAITSCAS